MTEEERATLVLNYAGVLYVNGQSTDETLITAGRVSDALLYARASLDNFRQAGPGAAADAADAERLIADLEQRGS